MKSKVVLVPCKDYEPEHVNKAIRDGIEALGGWQAFVQPGENILLKPNLLNRSEPEKCVSTHPAVLSAVGSSLQEKGFRNLTYGDSPGPPMNWLRAAETCKIAPAMEALSIPPGDFEHQTLVEFPQGKNAKSFALCQAAADCDALISVCKMKTHQLTRVTGAIKNTFGCVCGLNKGAFHAKFPEVEDFSTMLIDLNLLIRPRLYIMDGVMAMEGNGPGSGTPVHMGVILMSADPVALDSVFCRLIDLDPGLVIPIQKGEELGLGKWRDADVEVLVPGRAGAMEELLDPFRRPEFDVFRGKISTLKWRTLSLAKWFFDRKPVITKRKCVRCGACVEACPLPEKAVTFANGKTDPPVYDYKKCIRCFCCQEMCPAKAIDAKVPVIARPFLK
ncbi:MAG: DUF362 domain-containing protein [Firmicutes bacterium]|nr:DUF362 domain-containing protein [Bacillota bacterium]